MPLSLAVPPLARPTSSLARALGGRDAAFPEATWEELTLALPPTLTRVRRVFRHRYANGPSGGGGYPEPAQRGWNRGS